MLTDEQREVIDIEFWKQRKASRLTHTTTRNLISEHARMKSILANEGTSIANKYPVSLFDKARFVMETIEAVLMSRKSPLSPDDLKAALQHAPTRTTLNY
jgi:hypothetical protein